MRRGMGSTALRTLLLALKPEAFLLVDWADSLLPHSLESFFLGCRKLEEESVLGERGYF